MSSYWSRIKQHCWIVLACTLVATIIGGIIAFTRPPTYQATSIILVNAGAPGTIYPGSSNNGNSAADNLGRALNYAAVIPTRSVMSYVLQYDPTLAQHHYTADDLMADVAPSTSTTSATITLLATAPRPDDALLIANDVAKGFAAYIQGQSQHQLDAQRQQLQSLISHEQQQKLTWETKIMRLANSSAPEYPVDMANLTDTIHTLDTLQTNLSALPPTVNGDVFVVQLATMKDVVLA